MIARKTKIIIAIIITTSIVLITAMILGVLYLTTDLLKSNKTLFSKYVMQGFENTNLLEKSQEELEIEDLLGKNKYISNIEANINYSNVNSNTENNQVNKTKFKIENKIDKTNQTDAKNIKIEYEGQDVFEFEYRNESDIYAIKFPDITRQYISIENNNLKEFATKMQLSEEQIELIPDKIEMPDLLGIITFSDEEKETLKERYGNIIASNINNVTYSKNKNQNITINNINYNTNAYSLNLTKEQLNNIYINILETLKNDEIIMSKVDKIPSVILRLQDIDEYNTIKEYVIAQIDSVIEDIKNNNIGQDSCKITVYEYQGTTLRMEIETQEYRIGLNIVQTQNSTAIELEKEIFERDENIETFKIIRNNDDIQIVKDKKANQMSQHMEFNKTRQINENYEIENIISFISTDEKETVEIQVNEKINMVNDLGLEELNSQNNVILNSLTKEQVDSIINSLTERLNERSAEINRDEWNRIAKFLNLKKDDNNISETNDFSEIEINNFNAQFEFYQGENLSSDTVNTLLEVVSKNIDGIEIISNEQLKINIQRGQENDQLIQQILAVVENNKNKKYNVTLEYNPDNNMLQDILITIVSTR